MFVLSYTRVKDGTTYHTHYIAESYREGKKVKRRHILNITKLSEEKRIRIKHILQDRSPFVVWDTLTGLVSRDVGMSYIVLTILKALHIPAIFPNTLLPFWPTIASMIVNRLDAPCAKYSLNRYVAGTALASLLPACAISRPFHHETCYRVLDLLATHQRGIELSLFEKRNTSSWLFLYDITSTYFEGRKAELAAYGYSRDHRGDRPQITIALTATGNGAPVSVTVLAGNMRDAATVQGTVDDIKKRFKVEKICFVGDRGMITVDNVSHLKENGMDFILALRHSEVIRLGKKHGSLQLGLFDEKGLADVTVEGRRLIVCRNPLAGADTKRRREELLKKIEESLGKIVSRVWQGTTPQGKKRVRRLRKASHIQKAIDRIFTTYPLEKFYTITVSDDSVTYEKKEEELTIAQSLDGVYVLETTIGKDEMTKKDIQKSYKLLRQIEDGFKRMKGDLEIRPVFHWKQNRIKGHVFLCFLAYCVEQELYRRWHASGLSKEMEWKEMVSVIKRWQKVSVAGREDLKTLDANFTPQLTTVLARLGMPLG